MVSEKKTSARPERQTIGRERDVVVNDVVSRLADESEELVARRGVEEERRDPERDGHDAGPVVADAGARVQVVRRGFADRKVRLDLLIGVQL